MAVITKERSSAWSTGSLTGVPGEGVGQSGKGGAATRYPADAQASRSVAYFAGSESHPWANTTRGSAPVTPTGRRISVVSTRPAEAGTAPRAGVWRVGSVKVTVCWSPVGAGDGRNGVVVVEGPPPPAVGAVGGGRPAGGPAGPAGRRRPRPAPHHGADHRHEPAPRRPTGVGGREGPAGPDAGGGTAMCPLTDARSGPLAWPSSGGETRTLNLAVNSRSLCRLSYPGNIAAGREPGWRPENSRRWRGTPRPSTGPEPPAPPATSHPATGGAQAS